MEIITPITIDTSKRGASPRIYTKQGDKNTRVLHLTVTNGATAIHPVEGTTAVLRSLKPDGCQTVTKCTILEDGVIAAVLPEQLLATPGAVQADVALTNDTGQLLSTVVFYIVVEPSPINAPSLPDNSESDSGSTGVIVKKSAGQAIPPVISFVDDDSRVEIYTVLYPWLKQQNVPYCFAVPVGSIGGNGLYVTWQQLAEMAGNSLVSFSCHCVGDDVMSELTVLQMDSIIRTWFSKMQENGLLSDRDKVRTYMYCHGVYSDPIVRAVVSRYFRAGFTVTKGINTTPFDSFHMKRVGLFPSNGSFSLSDAKAYVDEVFEKGGWLVFFTHCYYDSFDLDGLTELVAYIRSKGVEIASVEDVLTQYGNMLDAGCFNKSYPDNPYLVTDYLGNTYSSDGPVMFDFTGTPTPVPGTVRWQEMELTTIQYRVIAKASSDSAGLPITSVSENLYVSEPVSLEGLTKLKLTGYAISGYGQFSFLNAQGGLVECRWSAESVTGAKGIYEDVQVEIPAGAVSVIVAGSSLRQMPRLFALESEVIPAPEEPPQEPEDPPQEPTETWQQVELSNTQYRLIAKSTSSSAGLAITASSENAYVSEPVSVAGYSAVKVTGNATSGYGKYSFLDGAGSLVECSWSESTAAGDRGNFTDEVVSVPTGAATIIISGNALRILPQLSVKINSAEEGGLQ